MNDPKNLISHLLKHATEHGADLHICPKSVPFARLGGKYGELSPVPEYEGSPFDVAIVKAIIGEILTPEQKSELLKNKFVDFSFTHGNLGRFRAYAYTQRGTHAITIHSLPYEIPDYIDLEFTAEVACKVDKIAIEDEKGLLIVAGDYYSGISATLAAIVDSVNEVWNYHISTIERPIEYLHKNNKAVIVQKEIGTDVVDFKVALEQVRYENPDIVMISDLRQEDLFSVMELAEERLVLAGVRTKIIEKDGATVVMDAVKTLAAAEAKRINLIAPFIPCPRISVLYQQIHETVISGELLTWDMCDIASGGDSLPLQPLPFGGGVDFGDDESDG